MLTNFSRIKDERRARKEFSNISVIGFPNSENKKKRISSLQPKFEHKWIKVNRSIPLEYFKQFEQFSMTEDAYFDDVPDSLECGVTLAASTGFSLIGTNRKGFDTKGKPIY